VRALLSSCDLTAPTRTVAFRTIGCKLNQCETAQMQESLRIAGYDIVGWHDRADVRVLNTCTVTAKSDRTCRREIRSAKRLDPGCFVAVTGCYAQVDPQAIAAIPGVDLVIRNTEKFQLAERLAGLRGNSGSLGELPLAKRAAAAQPWMEDPWRETGFQREFITHFEGYTRAFLKVQTGCDSSCSYCIIPRARGPARSMPAAHVVEQVRMLAERDFREIVLTGIDLGSWGHDLSSATGAGAREGGELSDLLERLLVVDAVHFRLSSIEPLGVDDRLLGVACAASERLARHFHLPLQSGSDTVLQRMRRPYNAERYARIVSSIAERFPDAALGADVIVGFPGETEEEFDQTLELVDQAPLTYVHVFSYSDRPGTAAARMGPKVHPDVIHERGRRLRDLGARKNRAFHKRQFGWVLPALVLKERSEDGRLTALTDNYMEALLEGPDEMMNSFVKVRLANLREDLRWEAEFLPAEGGKLR
jgi:threonylcarbamoyladenosine tRNA methylthiotransferase MtaB